MDEDLRVLEISGYIDVASINTNDKKRDSHLKRSDFFDVENFPKIILRDPATSAVITLYTDNTAQCSFWTTAGTSVLFGGYTFTWTENPTTKNVTIDIN